MRLVIDTATPACSAALINGDDVIAERHELIGRGHAEMLLPLIEDMLDGRRPDAILIGCGPGSFTGLRVGLAAAHGLAIGWQVPISGFSTLALLAAGCEGDGEIAIALHGGHGQLFVQSYDRGPVRPLDALQSLVPEEAARVIHAPFVIGSGAESLVTARGHGQWSDRVPRASDARFLPLDLGALPPRPIYGRAPDAKPKS